MVEWDGNCNQSLANCLSMTSILLQVRSMHSEVSHYKPFHDKRPLYHLLMLKQTTDILNGTQLLVLIFYGIVKSCTLLLIDPNRTIELWDLLHQWWYCHLEKNKKLLATTLNLMDYDWLTTRMDSHTGYFTSINNQLFGQILLD